MKILAVSDSHGDLINIKNIIEHFKDAEVIIHCGDGFREVQELRDLYTNKILVPVRGNCDLCQDFPEERTIELMSKKIYITHGHKFHVKYCLHSIYNQARSKKADILIFGHTHQELNHCKDGMYIVNPGSVSGRYGTCAVIDITEAGNITVDIVKVSAI